MWGSGQGRGEARNEAIKELSQEGFKEGMSSARTVRAAMLEFLSPCHVSSSGAALKPFSDM